MRRLTQGEMVMFFRQRLKEKFVDPHKFSQDLMGFYISKYLIGQLRDYYTFREGLTFFNPKYSAQKKIKARCQCKKKWPICYLVLERRKYIFDQTGPLFRTGFIMSNFKFDYFSNKQLNNDQLPEGLDNRINLQATLREKDPIAEEDLLMERSRHICMCQNEEHEMMKEALKDKISKQVANFAIFKKATQSRTVSSDYISELDKISNMETRSKAPSKKKVQRKESSDGGSSPFQIEGPTMKDDGQYQMEYNIDNHVHDEE